MVWQDAVPISTPSVWRWRILALILITGSATGHIAYLLIDCPLDLAPDEAHYWDWSRRLDWSYYSKGPLVAYLIRAACEIFGPWSRALIGSEMAAVRLPAVVCGSLFLASLYCLTVQIYRRESLAAAVVAIALTFPVVTVGSTIMTIDAPFTCCWGWALVFGHRALSRDSLWAWCATGVAVGLGILAKYTMILWPVSFFIFLLTSRHFRANLARAGYWVMMAIAAACTVPVWIWNMQHDWIGLWHVTNLAGMSRDSATVHLLGPFVFLGTQFALLLGYWFVAWVIAMWVHRPWQESSFDFLYLWWMSLPVFVLFLLFSFRTGGGEANWPIAAYISGMVLAAGWLVRQLHNPAQWYRRLAVAGLSGACILGALITTALHHTQSLYPVLARFLDGDLRMRRVDPTCRLRGWRTLAVAVDSVRDQLRAKGIEPVLAGSRWTLPGELAFYSGGQSAVYSIGLALGDRHSQYDCWQPNPVEEVSQFLGKTFIVIGYGGSALSNLFASVDPPFDVTHYENGEPVARWTICVCRDYRGCPPALLNPSRRH